MSQSQEANKTGLDPKNLTVKQVLVLRDFVRRFGGIERATKAADELAKNERAA